MYRSITGLEGKQLLPKDRYQYLFESSADAILIIEGDKFVDCNEATVAMLRAADREAVLQTHPSELSPEFQPDGQSSFDKANDMMAIAVEKGTLRFEWDHIRMDGEVFPVEVLLTPIPSENGYTLHTVWRDLTERKKLENELRHAQKMDAIGKLAGGIAHDFNNQLAPILGYAEMLKSALNNAPKQLEWVEAIESAGKRSAELVSRLMVFSHQEDRQKSIIDLNAAVGGSLDMLGKLIGEDIQLEFTSCDEPLAVEIDPGDIEQIIMNLASNARDALPQGGVISLSLDRIDQSSGSHARLQVSDQGGGMDAETLAQVFEPFFTTKGLGSGTGLGLSTVYSLVQQARGSISADSAPGQGSRFELLLPLCEPAALDAVEPGHLADDESAPTEMPAQSARILVVEDDTNVATLIDSVLSTAGYTVSIANCGQSGLSLLQDQHFDLIVSDIVMPGMSGPQMVKEKEALGNSTPVLFMSGYTDDRLDIQGFDSKKILLLRKPFAPSELLREAARALSLSQ
ncbi:MAG: ATP-binding protein [Halieaceae bacterium]